jgi:hypothetical protein
MNPWPGRGLGRPATATWYQVKPIISTPAGSGTILEHVKVAHPARLAGGIDQSAQLLASGLRPGHLA